MRATFAIVCTAALVAGAAPAACAEEIYRWVGPDGIVHYSDEKPRDDEAFTTVNIDTDRPPNYDPNTDPYSIENQARRINEAWSAIAVARDDRIEARRQAAAQTRAAAVEQPREDRRRDPQTGYGLRYYSPWAYPAFGPPGFQRRSDPQAATRQLQAIEQLNLSGSRPASINSGVHRRRVVRSEALPVTDSRSRQRR